MKIFFDNCDFSSRTGPNSFAARLARALHIRGHSIADPHDYDVQLAFIEPTRPTRPAARLVQRLDGIWFKPEQFVTANAGIRRCYESADAVIWQSDFDRGMTTRWWGAPRAGAVIRNGFDPRAELMLIEAEPMALAGYRARCDVMKTLAEKHEKVFVCSANWHPQKRLSANLAAFRTLRQSYPKSCLIVLGANARPAPEPNVYYAGSQPAEGCAAVYQHASWMIHLAWLDHCPNTVVEALSWGVPVICAGSGGTPELVRDNGIVLPEAQPYGFELADYDDPPPIDVSTLGELPNLAAVAPELAIDSVARRYESFFEGLL